MMMRLFSRQNLKNVTEEKPVDSSKPDKDKPNENVETSSKEGSEHCESVQAE